MLAAFVGERIGARGVERHRPRRRFALAHVRLLSLAQFDAALVRLDIHVAPHDRDPCRAHAGVVDDGDVNLGGRDCAH